MVGCIGFTVKKKIIILLLHAEANLSVLSRQLELVS